MNSIAKRPVTGLLALALVVGLGTAVASSAEPVGPGGRGPGGHGRPFLRALRGGLATVGLTDDQRTKIRSILESKKDGVQTLALKTRTDARALHDLASAPRPDTAAVGAAFLKVQADREAVRGTAENVLGEIRTVLTSEQQTKLDGYLAALRQMRRGRAARG
ncbi:MAG TPA: periplasmic heavy metal sensor [Thermoanaerobaculia bacterium]|nr:periplasmic heavy metal sensor [Thermoanaerobaculia bacterium]